MNGKTVVITGGTSGIGQAAAEQLARRGARIVLVARDPARAEAALGRLRRIAPDAGHALHLADLSRLHEMQRVGDTIAETEAKVDVLINNAGAWFHDRVETEDGFETTFALDHLSYFVLAHALRESLSAASPSRIVNTSSVGHRFAALDWADLQSRNHYRGFEAYCRAKLCNVLFTREIARRLSGAGVTANCFHPGFVASRFGDNNGGLRKLGFGLAKSLVAITPEMGAATLVYLASAPELADRSGGYYAKCRPVEPSRRARDEVAARRLWDLSAEMTRVGPVAPGRTPVRRNAQVDSR